MNQTTPPAFVPAPEAAAPSELPPGECAAWLGLDWGDKAHALALRARSSGLVETLELEHSAESLHAWLQALGERFGGQRVAVAVEASKGAIVAALIEHPWLLIYPVHPATSRRFSTAFTPSGAKDDVPDARTLLEILTHHRARLRLLVPHDPDTRRLGLLNEARRTVVDRRTLLSNQLTSLLKNYYPQALELTGKKRYAPLALAFLERWPELALLQQARPETLRRFYSQHQVRRPELVEERIEIARTARALSTDRALCEVSILEMRVLVAEMRLLEKHLASMEEAMAAAFAAHPEAHLFADLPGAGAAMAPRLERALWHRPRALAQSGRVADLLRHRPGHREKRAPKVGALALERAGLRAPDPGRMGRAERQIQRVGRGVLPPAAGPAKRPCGHPAQPRLQMAAHPLALLAGPHALRRTPLSGAPPTAQPNPLCPHSHHMKNTQVFLARRNSDVG